MSEPQILDLEAIENLRVLGGDDDGAFLKEIVGIFLADTPLRIAELDDALQRGDAPTFIRAAHSIKGSAANMGATAMGAVAERLEVNSRQGWDGLAPDVAALHTAFAQTAEELTRLLIDLGL